MGVPFSLWVVAKQLGKYAPSIATAILDHNQRHSDKIPLKGISIGNQWTDPNTQILTHAAQAFYLGLVDEAQSQHLLALAHAAVAKNLVSAFLTTLTSQEGDTIGALELRLKMFDKYNEFTGHVNWYDVRQLNRPYNRHKMVAFFKNETIKSMLHVPPHVEFSHRDAVVFHFLKAVSYKITLN